MGWGGNGDGMEWDRHFRMPQNVLGCFRMEMLSLGKLRHVGGASLCLSPTVECLKEIFTGCTRDWDHNQNHPPEAESCPSPSASSKGGQWGGGDPQDPPGAHPAFPCRR